MNPPRAIIPAGFEEAARKLNMSPGIVSGDHVFLTGVTGSDEMGRMPAEPQEQFRQVFRKVRLTLEAADLTLASLVEMTTYHVGLRDHFEMFDAVRLEFLGEPFPAWTAVEVAGLRREGALVEMRAVATISAS